jgi:putative membrane protein
VLLAAFTSSGIDFDSGATLILVVFLLSLFNLILKPVLVLFTLPFIIFTLGFGLWIINALLLLLVSELVPGFYVDSFLSALWGSLVISMTSLITNIFLSANVKIKRSSSRRFSQINDDDDEIIDI